MKQSSRARRLSRHYKRMHQVGGLNLVSLMDIFTILVFFLMVNSSDVKVMDQAANVKLPISVSEQQPEDTLVVQVTDKAIIVQGRKVDALPDQLTDAFEFSGLNDELVLQKSRRLNSLRLSEVPENGLPVTIMGDQATAYAILKKVMQVCVTADFRRVKLAVEREAGSNGG